MLFFIYFFCKGGWECPRTFQPREATPPTDAQLQAFHDPHLLEASFQSCLSASAFAVNPKCCRRLAEQHAPADFSRAATSEQLLKATTTKSGGGYEDLRLLHEVRIMQKHQFHWFSLHTQPQHPMWPLSQVSGQSGPTAATQCIDWPRSHPLHLEMWQALNH